MSSGVRLVKQGERLQCFAICTVIVGNFATVKASNFNKLQQLLTARPQAVQYQPVTIFKIQSISIILGIWFGTRGSEVQILSPRPIDFNHLRFLSSL
jgi:hypothetical protein